MRKCEEVIVNAWKQGVAASSGNTFCTPTEVYLHGNRIAYRDPDHAGVTHIDLETLNRWPTATTKSRLRALGCDYKRFLI